MTVLDVVLLVPMPTNIQGRLCSCELFSPATTQSDLVTNLHKLRQKIALMTLVEIVFRRPVDNRVISFSDIAAGTKQPPGEVGLPVAVQAGAIVVHNVMADACLVIRFRY
jgi:hypothetical protein